MIISYESALEYIFDFEQTRDYSLERIKLAAEKLWNPQNNYKIIHVTGTNWKWSVCNMCFSVIKNRWKKVWVFTSPHLIDIKERFKSNEWLISCDQLINIVNKIISLDMSLSYFEKCTLISFEYFSQIGCEYAIVEVGCGWMYDATNILNPKAVTITTIGYDHIDLLWPTLDDIAFHKSWIIKNQAPVFMNFHNEIIENVAKEKLSDLIYTDRLIQTNLIWDYQKKNAALAYEITKYLWVPENIILDWLKQVQHSGRLEYLTNNLLIDWAHNEQWLNSLFEYLKSIEWSWKEIIYCISAKNWKDIKNLIIDKFWSKWKYIIVESSHNLLYKSNEIKTIIGYSINYEIKNAEEIKLLAKKNPNILYVVFWSLYMIWSFYN